MLSRLLACGAALVVGLAPVHLRFGVAGFTRGSACAAIPGPELEAGTFLTVVVPDAPQRAFPARVGRPVAGCRALKRSTADGPLYLLEEVAESDVTVAVVVVGSISTTSARGRVELKPEGADQTLTVSSCTSTEGLHLAVWLGRPVKGERLWHQYWYLGYDLEPTCTNEEAAK